MRKRIKNIINFEIKPELREKYKAINIMVYFLIIMVALTLLSRFSDSLTIPRVTTSKGIQGTISHEIKGEGVIYESKETSVTTMEDIKIDSINVNVGDEVKVGDALVTLNMSNIESTLKSAEDELSKSNLAYNRAVEDYNIAAKKIDNDILTAKNEMDSAKSDYDSAAEEEKEEIKGIYEGKKSAYETLANSKEETLLSYKRAMEDAKSIDNTELSKKVEALRELKNNGGNVKSTIDGYVIKVNGAAGDVTASTSLIDLADSSSENKLTIQTSKDNKKLVASGGVVNVNLNDGKTNITNLKIESVKVNAENSEILDVTVKLPLGQGKIGEYGEMIIPAESKKYDVIVPLEAIHQDNKEYYVLVMGEKETILGNQQVANKISVTIADKNGDQVAVKDSALSVYDEIILTSNKDIKDGDRVRKESK